MYIETQNVIEFSSGFDNPPDNAGQTQIDRPETRGRGQKILIVDDSLAWLRFAREILTAGGYEVHACEHPPDALALFKQNYQEIDLVITDLQMPCLDGIELAAELLKINAALPVVLTSAAQVEMTSEKLASLGIRDFLTKPWDSERLFSVLRQVLAKTESDDTR
jgi:two-component system cell cycle sensor histidine kinase/response regulator CckA